jgi:hypothetical protein
MIYIPTYHYICYGIGAHINDWVFQWNIVLICKVSKHDYNYNINLQNTSFNEDSSMKFYTYKKATIRKNLLKSRSSHHMILKFCSLLPYVMIILMIINVLGYKMFFQKKHTWVKYI